MDRNGETTTTTTYDVHETRRGVVPAQVVPVTVLPGKRFTDVKARGCLNTCAVLQILLGLAIIALEAACVGLYYFVEESAVGIWVGIFAVLVGIVGLIASRRTQSTDVRRCIFITELLLTVLLAMKAFAFFCASAALLAVAVQYYYNLRNGTNYGYGYGQQGGFGGFYGYGSVGNGVYFSQPLETLIGLKATLMILYLILFLLAVIASALSCVNCCRRSPKQQMVMTVYPNGQPTVVQQHKV